MLSRSTALVACISLSFIFAACGKKKQSERGDAISATEEAAPATGDAVASKGNEATKADEPKADSETPAAKTGAELYAKLCASCHQTLDKSDVGKTSLAKLQAAIAAQPQMVGLKDTSEADLKAIVEALSGTSPGKGKGKAGEAEAESDDQ